MPHEIKEEWICPYEESAYCDPKERCCDVCGWNPEVAAARMAKILPNREAV